ncbi:MAG: NAD-dependent epimerase/dehydratase family protein [Myxococcaceae bacterium]
MRVALTGARGGLAKLLLPRLESDCSVEKILALDLAKPKHDGLKTEFRPLDLTRHDAEANLRDALVEEKIDTLFHLAFVYEPVRDPSVAHELEVAGSMTVMTAASAANVGKLIVPSTTALYGARGGHPAFLREEAPLLGCPGSRFISDKVVVEEQLESFRAGHPRTNVIVLRFAPIMGEFVDNPLARLLKSPVVPTLLGFDPLLQLIHEDDAAQALIRALHSKASGVFNVVGEGVMSLSGMIRHAGGIAIPLPSPVAAALLSAMNLYGGASVPLSLLNYLHYSWVADGRRASNELGFRPRYHTREAAATARRS